MNLAELKQWQSDREKILAWLKRIEETDPALIDETLTNCECDPEVRAFFVAKFHEREVTA